MTSEPLGVGIIGLQPGWSWAAEAPALGVCRGRKWDRSRVAIFVGLSARLASVAI